MSLKEDVIEMKKQIEETKGQSLAMEIIRDNKKTNTRICKSFTIVILALIMIIAVETCYLIYILNDIGYEQTTTEEHIDMDAEGNNNYIGGDNNGEVKNN